MWASSTGSRGRGKRRLWNQAGLAVTHILPRPGARTSYLRVYNRFHNFPSVRNTFHFPPLIPYTPPHSRRRRRHETTADDLLQRRPALLPVRVRAADGPRGRLDTRRRVRGNIRRHLHIRRRSRRRPVLPVQGGAAIPGRHAKVRVRALLPRLEQHAEPHRPRPRPADRAHRQGARKGHGLLRKPADSSPGRVRSGSELRRGGPRLPR